MGPLGLIFQLAAVGNLTKLAEPSPFERLVSHMSDVGNPTLKM